MSISERLTKAATESSVRLCKLGVILHDKNIDEEDRAVLASALLVEEGRPDRLNNAAIAKVLREEGYDLSNSAVDRHRRAECSCYRKVSR